MDLYWFWKWFFYFVVRIFFREVEVIGAENIPTSGAVIFVGTFIFVLMLAFSPGDSDNDGFFWAFCVGNHQNQFVVRPLGPVL